MADKIGRLRGILSTMRVDKTSALHEKLKRFGNSDMFNYATNKQYKRDDLKTQQSAYWDRLQQKDIANSAIRLPLNGFDEMIAWTEQGKLWKYPIDNEQGLVAEKEVPFEDHVFLDHLLEDFPDNENIRAFMELVVSGLAKNPWMTVSRKHEIVKFYKEYFEDHREAYKETGFDM